MRPVNQLPLSLREMKRSPFASRRIADNPPKPEKAEVSTRPERYSSESNRTCERSRGSKKGIGRALTSIAAGAATECSSGTTGFAGVLGADCAPAMSGNASAEIPAAAYFSTRRRLIVLRILFTNADGAGGYWLRAPHRGSR